MGQAHTGGPVAPPAETPPGQLLWRCRRGMKELDVVLERFVSAGLPLVPGPERAVFERLLTLPDPLLAGYLLGGLPPPDGPLALLVRRIRASAG